MKKIFRLLILFIIVLMSFGCQKNISNDADIIILYENDVHCAVDGYIKFSGLKKELQQSNKYVAAVSSGDFLQGGYLGTISKGENIVRIMNLVGYDALTLGNHEFDYKLTRLLELYELMETKPVCANFKKIESEELIFNPYRIVQYGKTKIAFLGITTPETIFVVSDSQFKDNDGNFIYNFSPNNLFETTQKYINAAKEEGADYIVALTHLGTEDVDLSLSSQALVQNTSGIDVVLDGHSHSTIESMLVKNKLGKEIPISSTGTKFKNIGKLTIGKNGSVKTELIPTEKIDVKDENVIELIKEIEKENAMLCNRVIGKSEVNLITHKDGKRIIRTEDSNIGNFCSDAIRIYMNSDVSFLNGGGIRNDISKGTITFNTLLNVFPFFNNILKIETTGQNILDYLELTLMKYPNENGSFPHVSGMIVEFDSSIPSSVVFDENNYFKSVEGKRRVLNVKVLDRVTGKYEPLDLEKKYLVASSNYILFDSGDVASVFTDAKLVEDPGLVDIEVLEKYIVENLDGIISTKYDKTEKRIFHK